MNKKTFILIYIEFGHNPPKMCSVLILNEKESHHLQENVKKSPEYEII